MSQRKSTRPIAIDLFSGCGGLTLGLRQAGFEVAAAIEIDGAAVQCYRQNHPGVVVLERDVRDVTPRQLRVLVGAPVALVAGCPPCQGFSRIGTRNASRVARTAQNSLYLEFIRIVDGLRPKGVLFENVPGFAQGSRFDRLCTELDALGYRLWHGVMDASRFGVPQRRKRLILMGLLGSVDPKPAVPSEARITVEEAFRGIPEGLLAHDPLHNLTLRHSDRVLRRIRSIPADGVNRTSLAARGQLRCHKTTDGFSDVYGRLRWRDVSPTITAGVYSPSKGRFLHPVLDRCITLREAAILQGFPAGYRFPVQIGRMRLASLIGNALPPGFVRAQALALRKWIGA